MSRSPVRLLSDADWQVLRDVRLQALRDSPDSFVASYEQEAQQDEQFWHGRMREAKWLIAERDGKAIAMVGLAPHGGDAADGEIFGLWVAPEARRSRVGRDMVRAAVEQAMADERKRLYFWVGSSNGPAVAFASAIGFRPTSQRRLAGAANGGDGIDEVAMVLALAPHPTSVVNPRLP